jgi:hypothetical protein
LADYFFSFSFLVAYNKEEGCDQEKEKKWSLNGLATASFSGTS